MKIVLVFKITPSYLTMIGGLLYEFVTTSKAKDTGENLVNSSFFDDINQSFLDHVNMVVFQITVTTCQHKLLSYICFYIYLRVWVVSARSPDQTKNHGDLKFGEHTPMDHILNIYLFFEKVPPKGLYTRKKPSHGDFRISP